MDSCPALLEVGRVRPCYYASSDNVDTAGPHPVHSAISSDGIHFADEVTTFTADDLSFTQRGLLEPRRYGVTTPVRLPDGTFRMYAFAQPDAVSFVSLRSHDGLAWALEVGPRFTAAAAPRSPTRS
ncbi:MAG: hypothetical protein FIA95_16090 [Gemmatimonadetes bacterium]|nr:hypothetical protein [Gemmatimonadota bacterium]